MLSGGKAEARNRTSQARCYKLVMILDDALEVMDNLMALDTKANNLDDARDYIKALAPWIKGDQIEYDSEMNPVGMSGAHTPFPPFHWKCRTTSSGSARIN